MKNKITPEDIEVLIKNCETQEHIFWEKELVVSYKLPCGFTIIGRAAVVDPSNFDIEIGRKIAKQKIIDQLYLLEGYRLQLERFAVGL